MKRLQIYIDEEVDQALAMQALHEGTSKAALVRRFVAAQVVPNSTTPDPLDALVGWLDIGPSDIDEVVYGQ